MPESQASPRPWTFQRLQSQFYLVARTFAIFAGSLLAIQYSKLLGPSNRGVINFVMLISILGSELTLGSLNLSFRTRGGINSRTDSQSELFRRISLIASAALALFVLILTLIYSHTKEFVPTPLLVTIFLYSILSIGTHQLFEYILALHLIVIGAYFEVLAIASQIICYFVFYYYLNFSVAINVMLSLCAGYATVWCLFLILTVRNPHLFVNKVKTSKSLNLISNAKVLTPQIFTISLIDRFDKLLIALFFSSAILGKYSLATALIIVMRYVPDSVAKLLIASRFEKFNFLASSKYSKSAILFLIVVPGFAFLNNSLVLKLLGKEWTFGIAIISVVLISEALRHALVLKLNLQITQGQSQISWKTPSLFVLTFFAGAFILKGYIGLIAIPTMASICYAFLLLRKTKLRMTLGQ